MIRNLNPFPRYSKFDNTQLNFNNFGFIELWKQTVKTFTVVEDFEAVFDIDVEKIDDKNIFSFSVIFMCNWSYLFTI